MQAIINENAYQIESHYTEQTGTLHLVITDDVSFDALKEDVKQTEVISIINDNEEEVTNYFGYNNIQQISANGFDEDYRVELVIGFNDIITSISSIQKKIKNITKMSEDLDILKYNFQSLQESITTTISQFEDLNLEYQNFSQNTENEINLIKESINNILQEQIEAPGETMQPNIEPPVEE